MYASNGTNTVSVIDTTTNTVTTTITVGIAPFGVAIHTIPVPSLTITKGHTGNFAVGRLGTYSITVGNNGSGPTNGTTVTVHDTLPRGLTAISITGSGWGCTLSTLTCTRSDVLAAGSSYPPISLTVRVLGFAASQVTNTATVTGGGDTATHTATDVTTIVRRPGPGQLPPPPPRKKNNALAWNTNDAAVNGDINSHSHTSSMSNSSSSSHNHAHHKHGYRWHHRYE